MTLQTDPHLNESLGVKIDLEPLLKIGEAAKTNRKEEIPDQNCC
jgi:hypothetical protein